MFKIESYIAPIILNHVAKYVKNIRPQDTQLSLWEGEVTLQNLDLRLDVLEEELKLPFEFLSGHIHELSIQVPWTKITSEPIRITINTIEFVLKLKNPREDGAGSSASSSPQRRTNDEKRKRLQEEQHQAQQSMGSGLVNKIINNITVQCHNIILKYVEEDIVVSMNVQLMSFGSADENWQPAMVDVHPVKVLMRKLVQISDLTICLDKRNSAGQIDVCQEPILYRCSLECRILRKYNANSVATTSVTRIGLFTKSLDMNVSSLQFPMAMRLIKLLMALKSGKIKNSIDAETYDDDQDEQNNVAQAGESYLTWAWNLLPSFTFEPATEEDEEVGEPPGHTLDFGMYVEELNFTLKNSEFVTDSIMGAIKRIRYTPIMRISLGGMYFERVSAEERHWSSIKAGLSTICVEPLGSYSSDERTSNRLIETVAFHNNHSFIDKSLFDTQCKITDKGWAATNYEEYEAHITDDYLLYRSPVLAFDLVDYKSPRPDEVKQLVVSSATGTEASENDRCMQYRLLSAGIVFRYNQTFVQVKNVINDFVDSYDYPAYYAERLDATAAAGGGANGSSFKLSPPLMEDYDALMQHIPLCTYTFDLKRISVEFYAQVEPEAVQKTQRRLSGRLKQSLPHFLLYFDHAEGSLSTPLKPNKLVHTTCQLPDKPHELLNACYDNYQLKLQDFSLALVNPLAKSPAKLLLIPKLQLSYGSLIQPQHWKDDEVPERKLELNCEQFRWEFSKREITACIRLLNCVSKYRPYLVWKVAKQAGRPLAFEDAIKLQNRFSTLCVQFRRYQKHSIWNASLRGLQSDVISYRNLDVTTRHTVLRTVAKVHNNKSKWLEGQAQFPNESKDSNTKTVLALWMESFRIMVDENLLKFLRFQEEPEFYFEKEPSIELEAQTHTLLPQTPPPTSAPTQPHSCSSMPPPLLRRSSRNSLPSRKISQPEETIHFSSERDDKVDPEANPSTLNFSKEETERKSWLKFIRSLVLNVEIEPGQLNIAERFQRTDHGKIYSEFTKIQLPQVVFKSTYSEYVARSNLRQKIAMRWQPKDTLNWTIALNDFALANHNADVSESILNAIQTTITIALTHRKEKIRDVARKMNVLEDLSSLPSSKNKTKVELHSTSKEQKRAPLSTSSTGSNVADKRSDSSTESDDEWLTNDDTLLPTSVRSVERDKRKLKDIVSINLHVDTTPMHFYLSTHKVKTLQQNLNVLLKLSQLMQPVAIARLATAAIEPIKIITAAEENPNIKEFLDLETNSESSMTSNDPVSVFKISLFCQWTITRIIIELESGDEVRRRKVILELEDLLSTVDKHEDFTKYTGKMGQFKLNYYEPNAKGDWKEREYLRIKMLGEATNLPLFNVIVTSVGLKHFYRKIGVKRKGNLNRSISEILITMQAIEVVIDLVRIREFMAPLCEVFKGDPADKERELERKKLYRRPITASDLPMIYLDSKGFTLYLPLEAGGKDSCTVAIWKMENIKITPNLDNPLQRNPIRTDVYSKAAQMGILSTRGSMVEDRQYELTLANISAASGNWNEILAHMRVQATNSFISNPAFEWNNLNRKTSLQLTDIFSNFTFIAVYAPCIVYNNVLICGQAIEFNCASDLVATVNTYQLNLMSCMLLGLQNILKLTENTTNPGTNPRKISSHLKSSSSESTLLFQSNKNSSTASIFRSTRSLSSLQRFSSVQEQRSTTTSWLDARGSASVFESIDEDTENNIKTDSGFQSTFSRTPGDVRRNSKERFGSITSSSSFVHDSGLAPVRHMPQSVSLVAGIFLIRLFDINHSSGKEPKSVPLLLFTISHPSFMITQNMYDSVTQVSLFNLSISMASNSDMLSRSAVGGTTNLFTHLLFDTRPGKLSSTGIAPPLFSLKAHRTKMKLLEVDAELSKPIVIALSDDNVEQLCNNLLLVYSALLKNPCFDVGSAVRPIVRGSKIKLMRQQCFNADRLQIKCNHIELKLTNDTNYNCRLVGDDLQLNVKFLSRPEKATTKMAIGAFYLKTEQKIFLHPVAVRVSADFVSEPWYRLPLLIATAKFNVVQCDVGISALLQLRRAMESLNALAALIRNKCADFMRNRLPAQVEALSRDRLLPLKTTALLNSGTKKQSGGRSTLQREEFYQDDLRAGAFQFVEMASDSFLPLPYQIQIIRKNFGIICWRYPQPRKMCKIHIFPVPMAVQNPIHIKCRMEYFSEAHECFLHYCDFWLSESVSKKIDLPERDICANIWRVVILQSLVSVNGECFDTSEEDEELQSIASMNIKDALIGERLDSDFLLHPKVLVGCMRIDTSFQSQSVPKVQLLVSFNLLEMKLLNQPTENPELPSLLKKFRLAATTQISQAFLILKLERVNFHAAFHAPHNYTLDSSLSCRMKCLDFGFLNMVYLLEPTSIQSYVRVNKPERCVIANIALDKFRLNFGPAIIHTLLASKEHWAERLDRSETRQRHAFIPKCIVVNRTHSNLSFGQTGTSERVHLQPKECHLYSFRSDYHSQELTFFMDDDIETRKADASQSVPIPFKFEQNEMLQYIRIGDKCMIIKSRKLSATQIYVLIKGQIELISMVPHDIRLEFRRDDVQYNDKQLIEYNIEQKGRMSFLQTVQCTTNIIMRLKFTNGKGKGRTGDIPLRTNKNLPWLVKVPSPENEFISLWVRILREDIPEFSTDKFQPQKILITIWPIFEICSMLSCPVKAVENTTKQEFVVNPEGGREVLNVPATHLTDHQLAFQYSFPLDPTSESEYTLTLKTINWNEFFWYDEQLWKIEDSLEKLSKANTPKWPLNDEEEMRVKRYSHVSGKANINYRCMPSREFSCTQRLELAPWGMFINASSMVVNIADCDTKERLSIDSNCLEMLFTIQKAFTLNIPSGTNWIASLPIYYGDTAPSAKSERHYVLSEGGAPLDVVILRNGEVLKFVLELTNENERKIFKLRSKFAVTNFTKTQLCVLPFAMDHKESATRSEVSTLDAAMLKRELMAVESLEQCIGLGVDTFYDINAFKAHRSNDTAFVCFVCIKICEASDVSIPIPLVMPFTRRCFSIQNGHESIALVAALIEKNGCYYLNIFEDISPAILVNNQTDVRFIVAQTSASENSKVSSTTPEYDGRHFEWFQHLPAYSKCYYTPPEMYSNFPDVESTICNLTLALYNEDAKKKNIKWSKPICTDKSWEKFLHVPHHGDVKVIICDKHRVIRVSIYYIAQQLEFSVKDIRLRLLKPNTPQDADNSEDSELIRIPAQKPFVDTVPSRLPTIKCSHFLNAAETKTQFKLRFFVKEFVLSINTDSKDCDYMKREIFGLHVDDFVLAYDDLDDHRQMNVLLANLQIDNQLYSSGKYDFPVVLCADQLYHRSGVVPQVHYLDRTYQELRARSPMALFTLNFFDDELKLSSIVCSLSAVRAYIEDAYLNDLLDAIVEFEPSNCVYKPKKEDERLELLAGQVLLPRDVAAQAICIAEPLQLRSFRIAPLSILLSVHTSVRMYIALDHSPLSFSSYERQQILTVPLRFGQSLGMHYLSGAIFGAGWVVGSLEILGSPSGLARSFTTGLRDFVSMPVMGLFRGPWGFIVGITQGSASLLRNVTAGTVNSVTKLAASVARNLDRLTLDPEHIERTEALRRSRPQGFTEGFSQGVTGLGISILGAVGGIAHHTLEARSPVEIVTGMGKGIVGAFTKPLSGAAELVALAGQGMLHTVGFNAMPQQRLPSVAHNKAINPSGYRIWKLLPGVLTSDQILFYHEVTLLVNGQMRRGFAFLTSAVFAITEAQWDKLEFVFPVDKVEMTCDANDKTLFYVRMVKENEEIEEDLNYTNQRIMTFLNSSVSHGINTMTADSLNVLLQEQQPGGSLRRNLDWSFYISEHLGEHLMQYLKIMNKTNH